MGGSARARRVDAQADDEQGGLDGLVLLLGPLVAVAAGLLGGLGEQLGQLAEDAAGAEGIEHVPEVLPGFVFGHGGTSGSGVGGLAREAPPVGLELATE